MDQMGAWNATSNKPLGDYEFLSYIQTMEEIILELNGYEEEVLSKMDELVKWKH